VYKNLYDDCKVDEISRPVKPFLIKVVYHFLCQGRKRGNLPSGWSDLILQRRKERRHPKIESRTNDQELITGVCSNQGDELVGGMGFGLPAKRQRGGQEVFRRSNAEPD
jgi:hypothetical protein